MTTGGNPMTLLLDPAAPTADETRREFLAILAASGLGMGMAACGDDDGGAPARRMVRDELGRVEVPTDPQRVVALYDDALDIALALGFPVVAGPGERGSASNPFPPHLPREEVRGVQRIETLGDGPDPERIAALRPDLILSNFVGEAAEDARRRLQPIAPVFTFLTYGPGGWRAGARQLARPFGRADPLAEIFARSDARAREVIDAVKPAGRTVASGSVGADGGIEVDLAPAGVHGRLRSLGFGAAPFLEGREEVSELSAERIGDIDADVFVFVTYGNDGDDEAIRGVTSSRLWDRSIETVTITSALSYFGPRSELAFLDAIQRGLT